MTVLGEIIQIKYYNHNIKGTIVEKIKKQMVLSLSHDDFLLLEMEEKIALLDFLISSYLDSKECRDFIFEKIEHQTVITKQRHEKKQRLRQIENEILLNSSTPALEEERHEIVLLEKQFLNELSEVHFRTIALGVDTQNNEYYFFKFEPDKIFVFYPSNNHTVDLGNWFGYFSKDSIMTLISELIQNNKKENKLRQKLENVVKNEFCDKNKIDENMENPEDNLENNKKNAKSIEKNESFQEIEEVQTITIPIIKEMIKNIAKNYSKFLKLTKKRWEIDTNEKKWQSSLKSSENIEELCKLLLEFSEKAQSPLRFQPSLKKKSGKYRKVILKLWQNSQEACLVWEDYIKTTKSKEELFLGLKIYEKVIQSYISKKKEEFVKHSDECFVCNDGGKLILCENCPRVAHLKCVGLNKIPEGEWVCSFCN